VILAVLDLFILLVVRGRGDLDVDEDHGLVLVTVLVSLRLDLDPVLLSDLRQKVAPRVGYLVIASSDAEANLRNLTLLWRSRTVSK